MRTLLKTLNLVSELCAIVKSTPEYFSQEYGASALNRKIRSQTWKNM